MVLYHTFNHSTQYQLGFRYLAFLPPTFILITGAMLTKVYGPRYCGDVDRRVLWRGFKLLLLFTTMNLALRLALPSAAGSGVLRGQGWQEVVSVFVVGGGYGVAFDVLLPIAYVLLLAPVVLRLNAARSAVLPACTIAAVSFVAWLEWQGHLYPNLSLASVGLVGALLGRLPSADHVPPSAAALPFVVAAGVCAGTTALAPAATLTYLLQSSAATSAVVALSFGSRAVRLPMLVSTPLALLGRYSLLAYILQIAVLYVLVAAYGRPQPSSIQFMWLFGATLLLTLAAAGAVEWLRPRWRWFDGTYRAVFA
jgi:hypothetical protein